MNQVKRNPRLAVVMSKGQAGLLDRSFQAMSDTEELKTCGLAGITYQDSQSADSYYIATDLGTYFGCRRATGFLKSEWLPEFVPHAEVEQAELLTPMPGIFLRCYRRGEGKHFLFFSFYLDDDPAHAAALGEAMGFDFK